MSSATFSFEGLDAIEERVLRRAEQIGYITIKDRTDRSHEDPVGRFVFDEKDALPYLEPSLDSSGSDGLDRGGHDRDDDPDDESEEDQEESENTDDGEEEDQPSYDDNGWQLAGHEEQLAGHEEQLASPKTTVEDIARAACRWLRDISARHCVGDSQRRFRVRIYLPKGTKLLDGGQFVCRNHDWSDEVVGSSDAMPDLRIPPPNFDQSAKDSTLKGIKALGDYYAQWGQIVLGSVGQLQGVNNSMLARLHHQLQESRGQVDELVASILEYRHNEVEAAERRRLDERAGDTRTELARDALQHLGTAASAYLTGRAVPPDLLETFGAITASSELTAALRDPAVRALMNEPDNLRGLAAMLQAAGQQAQAAQAGGQQPATGPPDADSPDSPTPETAQPEPNAAD